MKYWLTVHWPQSEGEPKFPWRVWLADGKQDVGRDLDLGDRVLVYQCKSARRIVKRLPERWQERPRPLKGAGGIIATCEVDRPLRKNLDFPKVVYEDGSEIWWCWQASLRLVSRRGFVPRERINPILDFKPKYYFRGFGKRNSGLLQISDFQYDSLVSIFEKTKR